MDTDILIAGGSLGGVRAAKAALSHGMKVILTEETDWIGGQLTSQAVPPDEHPWIEEQGRTQSYAQFRKAVREHYKNLPDASDKMKNKPLRELNPGNGWVSRVAHEPKVALAILQGYLAPYQKNGQLELLYGNIFEEPGREKHRALAKELTRSLIYWLQNEAPNEIGTVGFPVRPRGDVLDTEDGIAKAPYIRESRRIVAKRQIVEQDLAASVSDKPLRLEDSVGVGHYHIDLHSTIKTHTSLFVPAHPFEIPLSAMEPVRLKNLIPACKNIGTTHLTNGCFREHPTEWNIGETAGHLAAYCIGKGIRPAQVLGDVKPFQKLLELFLLFA